MKNILIIVALTLSFVFSACSQKSELDVFKEMKVPNSNYTFQNLIDALDKPSLTYDKLTNRVTLKGQYTVDNFNGVKMNFSVNSLIKDEQIVTLFYNMNFSTFDSKIQREISFNYDFHYKNNKWTGYLENNISRKSKSKALDNAESIEFLNSFLEEILDKTHDQ